MTFSPATEGNPAPGPLQDEALAYARVTIPLGKRPEPIDGNRVYDLEIQRLQQEIALLKMNAE